jgi:hypothetical protein
MKKLLRYLLLSVLATVAFLMIFNPSPSAFKEYSQGPGNPYYYTYRREVNYIIFSYYKKSGRDIDEEYLAIAGNFFPVSQ